MNVCKHLYNIWYNDTRNLTYASRKSEKERNIFEEKKGKGKARKETVHICRKKNCCNTGFCVMHAVCAVFYLHK